jgi:enoyl-CoA hydratase
MSDVLVRVEGTSGRITLNRPRAMNALTLEMIRVMYATLTEWTEDAAVHFVLMDGAGERGLCAGGDIRALYDAALSCDLTTAATFFREEYRLDYLISRYPKPYVALMDGVVMGGGIGISGHASHRVVTERSALAMPETSIGFVPDVGGTYLLGTAPDEFGTHLGLTGNRIGAADAIICRFADVFVPGTHLPAMVEELQKCNTRAALDLSLRAYDTQPPAGLLAGKPAWIKECYAADSVENIVAALATHPHPEAIAAARQIERNSPTSLKVTLQALRRARQYNTLCACLQQEYCISLACLRGHDFVEGVRAAVVDKDRNPIWHPARLEEVGPELVELHFTEPDFGKLEVTG